MIFSHKSLHGLIISILLLGVMCIGSIAFADEKSDATDSISSSANTPNELGSGGDVPKQKDTKIYLREPLPGQGTKDGDATYIDVSIEKKGSIHILSTWVGHIFNFVAALSVIIAILVSMFAGAKLMFSGGDSGAKGEAKEMIVKVMMGISLLFLAGLILNFVNPKFYVFGGIGSSRDSTEIQRQENRYVEQRRQEAIKAGIEYGDLLEDNDREVFREQNKK